MKYLTLVFVLFIFTSLYTFGQDKGKDSTDRYHQLEERYKRYKDSLAILYPLVPAISSIVLKQKEMEINLFNSLISANEYRNDKGKLIESNVRSTYQYNTLQLTYGISKKGRVNIGLDVNSITGRIDRDRNSSLFKIFDSEVEGNSQYASAVTSIGARARWRPFERNYRFTVQNSIVFPTGISTEKENTLGQGQINLLTQLLYNLPLNKRLFLFSQLGIQYGFKNDHTTSVLVTPISGYISYLLSQRAILFGLMNYVPIFRNVDSWTYDAYTYQAGGGLQYSITKSFLINGYYANDLAGKNYQDFDIYSISFRYIIR